MHCNKAFILINKDIYQAVYGFEKMYGDIYIDHIATHSSTQFVFNHTIIFNYRYNVCIDSDTLENKDRF